MAQESGVPFSSVVADALPAWLRGRLVDAWLAEHEAEFDPFDEAEPQALAVEAAVAYQPPQNGRTVA